MVESLTFVYSSTITQGLLYREDYKNVCLVQACLFPAALLMYDSSVSYACPQLCSQKRIRVCMCARACAVCPLCYACTSVPGVAYFRQWTTYSSTNISNYQQG